jgi:N-acylneuraminate cytidylyltransferase
MQNKPIVYAWIFARGGSVGLPGKNIKMLNGKPLIAHAIQTALESKYIDQVFVSTDDSAIAEVARNYGAEVPFFRPDKFASNRVPERLAWRHAVEWVENAGLPKMEVMVSLPPTAPLRTAEEVDCGIETFISGEWDTVISVCQTNRHPSFNVVRIAENGSAELAAPLKTEVTRRQDCQPLYDITTAFYVTSPAFVLREDSFWNGRTGAVEIAEEHAVDIDTMLDFEFTEFLMKKKDENS